MARVKYGAGKRGGRGHRTSSTQAAGSSTHTTGRSGPGSFICSKCNPVISFESYRRLSYHRENMHRSTFNFDVDGQIVTATRSEEDRKLSCPKCNGRWSDLNSFKKRVREICPPSTYSATKKPSTTRMASTSTSLQTPLRARQWSTESPLSSIDEPSIPSPASTPPPSSAKPSVVLPPPEVVSGRVRSTQVELATTVYPTRPSTKPGRFSISPFKSPQIRPVPFPPLKRRRTSAPEAYEPLWTATLVTSSGPKRKHRKTSSDGIWEPIERDAGLSLTEQFEKAVLSEVSAGEGHGGAIRAWWDVRACLDDTRRSDE